MTTKEKVVVDGDHKKGPVTGVGVSVSPTMVRGTMTLAFFLLLLIAFFVGTFFGRLP